MPNDNGTTENDNKSGFKKLIKAGAIGLAALVAGFAFMAVVDVTDQVFSTDKFCATTCHVMESTVYQELKESKHWQTKTGVRAGCADCHVDEHVTMATIDHIIGMKEAWVWLFNDFSEPGSFEPFREAGARRVRMSFLEDGSKNCRSCHVMEAIQPSSRGQADHEEAREKDISCIACHYNIVHKEVEPSEEFQSAIDELLGAGRDAEEEMMDPGFSDDFGDGDVL